MASEEEKPHIHHQPTPVITNSNVDWIIRALRLLTFFATITATLIMALNKQTKTFTVATIATVPIKATLTAKFQHTPAFVFFVVANGIASLHNFLMLGLSFFTKKFHCNGFAPMAIQFLDLVNVAIISGGASATAFMGQLGRYGNSHAQWNKICDKFDSYCDRGGGAMIASFIGLLLMICITAISICKLHNHRAKTVLNSPVVP